jgi:hypothetical protein
MIHRSLNPRWPAMSRPLSRNGRRSIRHWRPFIIADPCERSLKFAGNRIGKAARCDEADNRADEKAVVTELGSGGHVGQGEMAFLVCNNEHPHSTGLSMRGDGRRADYPIAAILTLMY